VLLTIKAVHWLASLILSMGLARTFVEILFWKKFLPRVTRPLLWLLGIRMPNETTANPETSQGAESAEPKIARRQVLASSALCIGLPAIGIKALQNREERQKFATLRPSRETS
jgi:hypothetical protein